MQKNVCINASNLHVGGGVQVATSFLYELSKMHFTVLENIAIYVSSEVDKNLSGIGANKSNFFRYIIADTHGIKSMFSAITKDISRYDIVFTIFGPLYSIHFRNTNIVGFAQAWIIGSDRNIYKIFGVVSRASTYLKFFFQWQFFRFSDALVVEADFVKTLLHEKKNYSKNIFFVSNTLSNIYFTPEKWLPCPKLNAKGCIKIGIISRDYPHKNLQIFPSIGKTLKERHGLNVRFFVTLNKNEWAARDVHFKSFCENVGSLDVAQCPNFYAQLDGAIFPSLLECFSASPLEALAMKIPLFASNRPFVTEICKEHAHYFDPRDAISIADTIAAYYKHQENKEILLKNAFDHVANLPTATDRAEGYLAVIKKFL